MKPQAKGRARRSCRFTTFSPAEGSHHAELHAVVERAVDLLQYMVSENGWAYGADERMEVDSRKWIRAAQALIRWSGVKPPRPARFLTSGREGRR